MDFGETGHSKEMQQENQKACEDDATNNNIQTESVSVRSEESLTLPIFPAYDSRFLNHRFNEESSTSDKDTSTSDKESIKSSDELIQLIREESNQLNGTDLHDLVPGFYERDGENYSSLDKNEVMIDHNYNLKMQEACESVVGQFNKISLKYESCDRFSSHENDFENLRHSPDSINVSDCSSEENKQSIYVSERSSSLSHKTSDDYTNILKSKTERKENSSRTLDWAVSTTLMRYPVVDTDHFIHSGSSASNFFGATLKSMRAEKSSNSPDSEACPIKFSLASELPRASIDTKESQNSNMLTCNDRDIEEKFNSSNSPVCQKKLSRSWDCTSNSSEFTRILPNYNKRNRKSFLNLNPDDSETSSDDANGNIPRKRGTRKKRRESSKNYLILPRAESSENVLEDAYTVYKRNHEEKSECLKENESMKNGLRSLEMINSEKHELSRKRHVSNNESEDAEKRYADSKQKKLKHSSD